MLIIEVKNNFMDHLNDEIKRRMRDKSDITLISRVFILIISYKSYWENWKIRIRDRDIWWISKII